ACRTGPAISWLTTGHRKGRGTDSLATPREFRCSASYLHGSGRLRSPWTRRCHSGGRYSRRDQIRSDDSCEEPHKATYIRRASWPVGPAGRCLHGWRIDKLEERSPITVHVVILTAGVAS